MNIPLALSAAEAAAGPVAQPPGALPATKAPGLVTFRTSDTPTSEPVEIDQVQARKTRLRRSVTVAARMFEFVLGPRTFKPAMLTLTYRDVDGYKPCHVSELLVRIRNWLDRRGHKFRYVWVAELQKRGALHYHVLIWLPKGLTLPKPDKQGWWPHGSTRIEWARNAIGYLCKYVSKFDDVNAFPKGARLHGSGGHEDFARQIRQWFNLPSWLKSLAGVESRFVRIKGVGLVERSTGLCVQSPWRVSVCRGRVSATRLFTYDEALPNVSGPYTELAWHRA